MTTINKTSISELEHLCIQYFYEDGSKWKGTSEALHPGWLIYYATNHPLHEVLLCTLRQLEEHFGVEDLQELAQNLYFVHDSTMFPGWKLDQSEPAFERWHRDEVGKELTTSLPSLMQVLEACLMAHMPGKLAGLLEQRVNQLLKEPQVFTWVSRRRDLLASLALSLALPLSHRPDHFRTWSKEFAIAAPRGLVQYHVHPWCSALGLDPFDLGRPIHDATYERYKHTIIENHSQAMFPTMEEVPYLRRLLSELVIDLEQPQAAHIIVSGSAWLRGKEALLYAAQHHHAYNYKLLSLNDYRDWRKLAITRMAAASHVEPEDPAERANLIARLRQYPPTTLKALLPVATNATSVILEALGWPDLQPLARLLLSRERFERAQALELLHLRDEKTMASFIRMFQRAHVTLDGIHHRTSLFEAIMGWNRDWVLKSVRTNNDIAVRAYALLPLERDFAEVIERYRLLQELEEQAPRSYKDSYRLQRARQSIEEARAYLAEAAGYADVAVLRQAVEEGLPPSILQAEQGTLPDNPTSSDQSVPQTIDDWQAKLLDTEQRPTLEEVRRFLEGWLQRGDEQGREGWGWYLLAREYLEIVPGLPKELSKQVEQRLKKLSPPTTTWQADSLAKSGKLSMRILARLLPTRPKLGAKAAHSIRALIQIDDPEALPLAAQYAELEKVKTDRLLELWQYALNADEYMRLVVAPAFAREGRTTLKLGKLASLKGIRHLTMLDKLELEGNKELGDISELSALTDLRELQMPGWQNVEDIHALGKLKQLEVLNLGNCKKVKDVSCLYWLNQLRWLNLSLTGIDDISGFSNITHLEYLNLNGCRKVRTLVGLTGLKHLAELNASWTGIRSLKGFGNLPRLSKLDISKCQYLITLQGLGDISYVRELELHHTPLLKSLQGLGKLPHLKRLSLTGCQGLQDLRGIESLNSLEWLNLESCRLTSLTGLENLPLLQHINILNCEEIQDFSPLGHLPNLRLLIVEDLQDLTHITALQAFQIEQLTLRRCSHLCTLEGIAAFAGLKLIQCQNCDSLAYVGELLKLPHLEQAAFFQCAALKDVNELRITGLTLYHI